jgi:hypothetical protein
MESALWFRQRCLNAEESHFNKQRVEALKIKQEPEEEASRSSIETILNDDEEEQQSNENRPEINGTKKTALEKETKMEIDLLVECMQQNEVPKETRKQNDEDLVIVLDSEDDDDDELLVEMRKNCEASSSKKTKKTTGRQKISCPHCAQKFFLDKRLQSHLVCRHKLNNEENVCLKRLFKCNIDGCVKTFSTAVRFKIHKAAHAGEKKNIFDIDDA